MTAWVVADNRKYINTNAAGWQVQLSRLIAHQTQTVYNQVCGGGVPITCDCLPLAMYVNQSTRLNRSSRCQVKQSDVQAGVKVLKYILLPRESVKNIILTIFTDQGFCSTKSQQFTTLLHQSTAKWFLGSMIPSRVLCLYEAYPFCLPDPNFIRYFRIWEHIWKRKI